MDKIEAKQRSAMIAVIECWKRNRCLWDPANPNSNNVDARNKAFKSVLMLYRKLDSSATLLDIRKKLNNMKGSFKREYKKVKKSQSMKDKGNVYVPKLWYYRYLLFLLNTGVTTNKRNSVGGKIYEKDIPVRRKSKTSNAENSIVNQHTIQEEVVVQQQAQETESPDTKEVKPKELLLDNINTPLTPKECEWEIIAKSIGLQLKNLEPQQQDIAHKLISDIIFYGKRGKLSESTTILIEPHHPSRHRSAQIFDPLRASNYHSSVLSPQSIYYRPHTPSSSISSPPIVSSQSDYRFSPITSQRYLQRPGTQPTVLPLETAFHHTHVEQGPICVEVTGSPGMKQEEIIISDNEDSDVYVFSCS